MISHDVDHLVVVTPGSAGPIEVFSSLDVVGWGGG